MIRQARASDVPWVEALWVEWLEEFPLPYGDPAQVLQNQLDLFCHVAEGRRHGVALVDAECAVLLWSGQGEDLHGFGVYVAKSARGNGLGTQLVARGCEAAKAAGFKRVLVSPYTSNALAIPWLEASDFRPVQTVMVREL